MKNNKIRILLILLLQGLCFVGFAQCPPPGGNQDPPGTTPPYPDPIPSSDVDITSEAPVDPNEIIGLEGYNAPESTDTLRWVSATHSLAYTIYFENDAELAMAAASKVTITVPLHEKLNYATFGVGSFGFGSHIIAVEGSPSSYQTRIDLRDSLGIFLDVVAGLDIVHNEAFWIFQSIDPATGMPPTAINMGFLPINDSLHSGEGFVTFSIKPQTNDCLTGDTITATASIVFDVNEAIATNTWLNTVDAFPPTSTLSMLPNGADQLAATFSGEDDEGGCGIKQFKLYCSQNEGAYQLYGIYPVGTTPQILLETGVEYRFFVLAEDNVGNCEPMKTEPEFTIGTNFVTLAVNAFPQEAGTVTGGDTYSVNDTAQLSATAAEGYHFVNWMSQGVPVSTQNPYSAVVSQNQTYTAYFERNAYTLQTLAAAGSAITVFDLNGNEVPSGSTILHSDRLIVRIDTSDCYVMESILLNGVAYIPGDTLTVTGNITLVTSTVNLSNTEFVEATACDSYRWNDSTYTVSGDYVRTFTNVAGCDSVVNLHLTVNHSTHNVYDTIVCGRYEWHGETYTMSDTYTYAYTNENDCASVDTLHLTVKPIYTMTETQTVCESELPIIWNGVQFTEADTKTVTLPTVDGCDSVVEMTLVVNPLYDVTEARTICAAALPYEWNGVTFNEAGSRTVTLQSTKSCDSVVTMILSVNTVYTVTDTKSICNDELPYEWNGVTFNEAGTETVTLTSTINCDSVVTMMLTVNMPTEGDTTAMVCGSFDWHGYMNLTASGDYTDVLTNAAGCDSTVTLHLTVNHGTHNVLDTTVCESFTWSDGTGETYTVSDTYTYAYTNENGCASVDTLHLTVNHGTHNVLDITVCESFTWSDGTGETYIVSDTYTHAYTNENGCASVDTLHLTVNYGTHNVLDTTVCESFTWSDGTGETYTVSDTYTHAYTNENGCASVDTLHLTVNYGTHNVLDTTVCESFTWSDGTGETYTVSDTYTHAYINEDGCASVDTLYLTVNYGTHNVLDTTVCESFTWSDGTGETYIVSDTYTHAYTNENGCASVDTLHLTVNYGTHNVLDTTVCESFTWSDGTGEIYTVSDTYTHAYINENGCASVDTLHLTVNYGTHNVLDTTVCESFTWTDGTGETYIVSDTYTHAYTNENGCASVDTLHLTVNYGTHNVLDTTVCESFTWTDGTGDTYTVSDTYTHAYINENGCASVDTLYLTVNHGTHNVLDTTVCESFTWTGGTSETYTQTGTYTYEYTNNNGCASVDTLHLTVNYGTHNVLDTTVCESFTWSEGTGETYTVSDTYTQAYTNENGCASVDTLHLTVNYGTHNVLDTTVCESFTWSDGTGEIYTVSDTYTHAYFNENGCASVDTLHLTVNYGTHNVLDTTVCESFTWSDGTGEIYTVSDTYTHAYINENGCASVDTLHLTVNHGGYVEVAVDTCGTGYYWALADTTLSQSGTYYHYSTNVNACPDTTVLMLSLYQSVTTELSAQICEGEVYAQNGFNVSTAGDHYLNLQTAHGCDSVVILHLTVGSEAVTYLAASICEGDSYQENGFEIFSPAEGIYEYSDTIGRVGTCDSIVVLTLTVNAATSGDTTAVVNSSFDWYGQHLTTSGDYTSTLTNVAGCDSVVTLHLTVNYSGTGDTTAIACDEFDWYEHMNLTQSGDYTHTFTNIAGGDSVVTLHLTVNHSVTEIVEATACGNYTWNDIVYTESGDYERTFTSANGCDSTVVLHLTVIDLPELSMIQGEPVICRNQYSMYFYDITNSDYNYYWYHNSQFLAGNVPSVVLYEENSGTHTLMMQVEDVLNGCYADTSMSILVQNALAPDTTVIMRKNNTNILICSEVSSEYGTVHYRWGYTNLFTHEETIMEGDYNYCMFDIGIDLESYLYWVETYIQYADGVGCANRTYYGHSIYTDIADYEHNTIDARVVNNQLVLHVNAAAPDMIDVILYGINGQLLLTQHYGNTDQVNDILPFQYSNGLYLLIVRVGNQVYPVKLLKY